MRSSWLLVISVLLFPVSKLAAQELRGKVLTENGLGAYNVKISFTASGSKTTTKGDGTFKIKAGRLPDTIHFSGTGFEPYTVVVTEKTIAEPGFEVVLLYTRKKLNEVVVTSSGYADASKISSYLVTNLSTNPIPGAVPGVKITDYTSYGSKEADLVPGGTVRGIGYLSPGIDDGRTYFSDTNIAPREGQLAKSRIITAGEVNDFHKWKMWEDYSENDFNNSRTLWGMHTSNRYSLQLTNRNHDAVINEPVFLINRKKGDTAWKTYTDNTGKAELWAGFTGAQTGNDDYYITDSYGHSVSKPLLFSEGMNVLVIDRSCNFSDAVDISFMVDATGSMGDEIEFLKLELEDVIRHTMKKYQSLSLRASSIFYRDKGDMYLTRLSGFSDNLLRTMNFIKLQRADGGGDYAEAADDALQLALDSLQWNTSARTRLLFLVLDAPPHADAAERMQRLTMRAAAMGIRIVPVACSGTDKSTEFLLRSMALATNGTYTFLTSHSGIGGPHMEPTTDRYEVELLNNLLQRIIGQYLQAKDCNAGQEQNAPQVVKQPENILAVKLYPNPTNGRFTIESTRQLKEIFITDFTGKILQRLTGNDKLMRWNADISNYPGGAYLVKYITADNKWGAEKVILMR